MQIVIEIPKETYEFLKKYGTNGSIVEKAVLNGTPLPKGHGDLIDRKDLLENTLCKTFGLRSVDIENAQTIIEAE